MEMTGRPLHTYYFVLKDTYPVSLNYLLPLYDGRDLHSLYFIKKTQLMSDREFQQLPKLSLSREIKVLLSLLLFYFAVEEIKSPFRITAGCAEKPSDVLLWCLLCFVHNNHPTQSPVFRRRICCNPFSQWQDNFHMKTVLSLVERLMRAL